MSEKIWFLLQFKPNSHRLAERNLLRQNFETFLPMQEVTRRKSTRFVSDLRPLFPGYMFVAFDPQTDPWRKINGTFGVSKLVSFNGKPKPVPLDLIASLMRRCDVAGKLLPSRQLATGDQVKLLTGPFANFVAKVDTIDSNQRIWILMECMGQRTRVHVTADFLQLSD